MTSDQDSAANPGANDREAADANQVLELLETVAQSRAGGSAQRS